MPNLKNCLRFLTPCQPRPEYPLFVFLPGMDGTGRLLHRQTPSLQKTFDIRCLAIPPDDLTDWDAMAKQVIALIEAELKPRCAARFLFTHPVVRQQATTWVGEEETIGGGPAHAQCGAQAPGPPRCTSRTCSLSMWRILWRLLSSKSDNARQRTNRATDSHQSRLIL